MVSSRKRGPWRNVLRLQPALSGYWVIRLFPLPWGFAAPSEGWPGHGQRSFPSSPRAFCPPSPRGSAESFLCVKLRVLERRSGSADARSLGEVPSSEPQVTGPLFLPGTCSLGVHILLVPAALQQVYVNTEGSPAAGGALHGHGIVAVGVPAPAGGKVLGLRCWTPWRPTFQWALPSSAGFFHRLLPLFSWPPALPTRSQCSSLLRASPPPCRMCCY